jgi:hypothetical protein
LFVTSLRKQAKLRRRDTLPLEISEDELTSTQRTPRRYPVPFQLRYKAISNHGTLHGFGQSRMMSSKDIVFAPGDGLEPGMKAEIAVAWPFLLDGHIRLQLVLETTITGSQGGVAEARILSYHFRTRRSEEAEQREEPARTEAPPPAVQRHLAAVHA